MPSRVRKPKIAQSAAVKHKRRSVADKSGGENGGESREIPTAARQNLFSVVRFWREMLLDRQAETPQFGA
jgi:hypothetical protein